MKKMILSLVATMLCATATYAQNTLVATLSHGEDISMYYGTYALRSAYNAAVSGDVINLSGGSFQAVTISKAITLRGTGIDDAAPTYISGNFTINIPTEDANRLTMEGIRCNGTITMEGTFNNPYFVKSQFYSFSYNNTAAIKNAMFANCKITEKYLLGSSCTVQFVNSYINGFSNNNTSNSGATFINCVIQPYSSGYSVSYIYNSLLQNCIIYQTSNRSNNLSNSDSYLPGSSIATNCVSIGYSYIFNNSSSNSGNKLVNYNEFAKVFKDFTGTYSNTQTFELSDEAKTTYLGTDGTEVGIYGGPLPYTSTPSYPQITKMNVANKTTADGKLSVEIEVSAAQ